VAPRPAPSIATTAMPRTTGVVPGVTTAMGRTAMQPQQQRPPQKDRTGMYAVVGFLALIALVAGAVVLFNVLKKDSPSEFGMPNVVGAKLEDGVKTLQDVGLVPNPVEEANAAVAPGTIGRTEPIADTLVKKGQTVDVFFTAAVTPFVLPDVSGQTQADALAALQLLGLTVDPTIITENNPDVPAGTVIRTDPPAGTTMQQGDTIKLVVSAGPNQVAIPPTEGLSQANAEALLTSEAFGFAAMVPSNRKGSCGTTVTRSRRLLLLTLVRGTPPTSTKPAVGSARRAINRPSVVLPDPVSPTTATCWPAGMCAFTSSSTGGSSASPRVR